MPVSLLANITDTNIDPWGGILAELGKGPGVATAEFDLQHLRAIRRRMPVADHLRLI